VVQCGGQNYLARSTDEGSTWPILHGSDGAPVTVPASPVPAACGSPAPPGFGTAFAALGGGGPQLRVDTAGNLYAVEKATDDACHSTLLLRISQDGGLTWNARLNMVAPAPGPTLAAANSADRSSSHDQGTWIGGSVPPPRHPEPGRPLLFSPSSPPGARRSAHGPEGRALVADQQGGLFHRGEVPTARHTG